MNAIGMHYGFWSHNWNEIDYYYLIPKIARLGFDVSEVASAEFAYYSDEKLKELKQLAERRVRCIRSGRYRSDR